MCVRSTKNRVASSYWHLEEFTSPLLTAGAVSPHFLQAVSIANHTEREALLNIQQSVWATLAENLTSSSRKQMHHHHGEPISEPASAVERTIDGLTGLYPVVSWAPLPAPALRGWLVRITAGSLAPFQAAAAADRPRPTDDTMNHVAIPMKRKHPPIARASPARP